jgi:multicomponent Na+:H+ antiporter subunit F
VVHALTGSAMASVATCTAAFGGSSGSGDPRRTSGRGPVDVTGTVLGWRCAFLLLNLLAGLWRIALGPTAADRMLAVLLFGSTTVAVLLIMAEWLGDPTLRTVALLFVVLATIVTLAFVGTYAGDAP